MSDSSQQLDGDNDEDLDAEDEDLGEEEAVRRPRAPRSEKGRSSMGCGRALTRESAPLPIVPGARCVVLFRACPTRSDPTTHSLAARASVARSSLYENTREWRKPIEKADKMPAGPNLNRAALARTGPSCTRACISLFV